MSLLLGTRRALLHSAAPAYDSATVALLAAMTTQPSAARATVIDTAIKALKSNGLWAKMGLLYVIAAHSSQAATLNWLTPGTATLTLVNSPTFTTDRGIASDGSTSYASGPLLTAVPLYTQNACHAGVWSVNGGTQGTNALLGAAANNNLQIITNDATGGVQGGLNAATSMAVTTDTLTFGHSVGVRTGAAAQAMFRNGGNKGTSAATSAAVAAAAVQISKSRAGGAFQTAQCALAHLGDQLSDSDVANLYTIFRTYMTAVGVP